MKDEFIIKTPKTEKDLAKERLNKNYNIKEEHKHKINKFGNSNPLSKVKGDKGTLKKVFGV